MFLKAEAKLGPEGEGVVGGWVGFVCAIRAYTASQISSSFTSLMTEFKTGVTDLTSN